MAYKICLFEDAAVTDMYPLTLTRPSFGIGCAGYTLAEIARMVSPEVCYVVRPYLGAIVARDWGECCPAGGRPDGSLLFLNGAVAPDVRSADRLKAYLAEDKPFLSTSGQRIAAALVRPTTPLPDPLTPETLSAWLLERNLPIAHQGELKLFDYPFHTVGALRELFPGNVQSLIRAGGLTEKSRGVWVGKDVKIADTAVFHTEGGPVVLLDGAEAMDFTYFAGPVIVGRNSRVIERSSVKAYSAGGSTTASWGRPTWEAG